MSAPLVSIISATFNAARELPFTLAAMAAQRGASFEWLVVDGGSSDGTAALLAQSAAVVSRWISEPDRGIYDAWNKGCAMARGEWLLFMGAGDDFPADDALERFSRPLQAARPAHDLVYGRLIYLSQVGRRELEQAGAPWQELAGRWELGRPALPPHPATFHHRSLFDKGARFDPRFRIVGDSHFLLRYALARPPLYVPLAVCRTPLGGTSFNLRSARPLAREIDDMNRELGLVPPLRHRLATRLLLEAKAALARLPTPMAHGLADLYRRASGLPRRWSVR